MKRFITLLIVSVFMFTIAAGCGNSSANKQDNNTKKDTAQVTSTQTSSAASWTITIEGVDGKTSFTSDDYAKLTVCDVQATLKKKDGSEQKNTWTGVLLSDILQSLGVKDYTKLTVTAKDNYSMDYTPDIVNCKDSILAVKCDGKDLSDKDAPAKTVIASQPGDMWVRNVAKITVVK